MGVGDRNTASLGSPCAVFIPSGSGATAYERPISLSMGMSDADQSQPLWAALIPASKRLPAPSRSMIEDM